MKGTWLASYWIVTGFKHGPFGFGVTAWSVEDAIQLIKSHGFEVSDNLDEMQIRENVTFAYLDQNHVVPNMGPMVMRGVWYPRLNLGFPPRYLGSGGIEDRKK